MNIPIQSSNHKPLVGRDCLWDQSRLYIEDCNFLGCGWQTSPNKHVSGFSLPKARGLMIEVVSSNLILSLTCLTANEIPGLGSLDFL